jgi:hypothetical protein
MHIWLQDGAITKMHNRERTAAVSRTPVDRGFGGGVTNVKNKDEVARGQLARRGRKRVSGANSGGTPEKSVLR